MLCGELWFAPINKSIELYRKRQLDTPNAPSPGLAAYASLSDQAIPLSPDEPSIQSNASTLSLPSCLSHLVSPILSFPSCLSCLIPLLQVLGSHPFHPIPFSLSLPSHPYHTQTRESGGF